MFCSISLILGHPIFYLIYLFFLKTRNDYVVGNKVVIAFADIDTNKNVMFAFGFFVALCRYVYNLFSTLSIRYRIDNDPRVVVQNDQEDRIL